MDSGTGHKQGDCRRVWSWNIYGCTASCPSDDLWGLRVQSEGKPFQLDAHRQIEGQIVIYLSGVDPLLHHDHVPGQPRDTANYIMLLL